MNYYLVISAVLLLFMGCVWEGKDPLNIGIKMLFLGMAFTGFIFTAKAWGVL